MKWSSILSLGAKSALLSHFRVEGEKSLFLSPNPKCARGVVEALGMENRKPVHTAVTRYRKLWDQIS